MNKGKNPLDISVKDTVEDHGKAASSARKSTKKHKVEREFSTFCENGSLTILACPLGLIAHLNQNRLYMGGVVVVNPGMGKVRLCKKVQKMLETRERPSLFLTLKIPVFLDSRRFIVLLIRVFIC